MRVVLDANIYVSSLISEKGNPAQIVKRWLEGDFEVAVSQPIVDELIRVTGCQRLQNKYQAVKENRLEFVALVMEQGIWVAPSERLTLVIKDDSDNRYIECAVAGDAQYIVTGDRHLLELGHYLGIHIVYPMAFITLLETGQA